MVDETVAVCLVGATEFGKTSLIATTRQCIDLKAYGYGPQYHFAVAADPLGPDPLSPEAYLPGTYHHLEDTFFRGGEASSPEETATYQLDFTMTRTDGAHSSKRVAIADTGGGVMAGDIEAFKSGDFRNAESETRKNFDRYRDKMPEAKALVLVIPLHDFRTMTTEIFWNDRVSELLKAVARKMPNLKRIAIVMTHYERLFVDLGAYAAEAAVEPDTVRCVLRDAVLGMQHQNLVLSLFDHSLADRQVVFMAASSHGFVRSNGCPNFNPEGNLLLHRATITNNPVPMQRRIIWRPFCTADPFLFAAFGEKSELMFTLEELGVARADTRVKQKSRWLPWG